MADQRDRALRESTRHNNFHLPGTQPYTRQQQQVGQQYDHEATKCHLRFGPGGLYPIANNRSQGLKSNYETGRTDNLINSLEGLSIKEQCDVINNNHRDDVLQRSGYRSKKMYPRDNLRFGPMGLVPATPKPSKYLQDVQQSPGRPSTAPQHHSTQHQQRSDNYSRTPQPSLHQKNHNMQHNNINENVSHFNRNSLNGREKDQPKNALQLNTLENDQNRLEFAEDGVSYVDSQDENWDPQRMSLVEQKLQKVKQQERENQINNSQNSQLQHKQKSQQSNSQIYQQDEWDRSTVDVPFPFSRGSSHGRSQNYNRSIGDIPSRGGSSYHQKQQYQIEHQQPDYQTNRHQTSDKYNKKDQIFREVQQNSECTSQKAPLNQQTYSMYGNGEKLEQKQQEQGFNQCQKQSSQSEQQECLESQQQLMGSGGGYQSALQDVIKDQRWENVKHQTANKEYGKWHVQEEQQQQAAGLPSSRIRRHRDIGKVPDRELLPYPNPNFDTNSAIRQFRPRTAPPPVRVERTIGSNQQLDRILGLAKTGFGHQTVRDLDYSLKRLRPQSRKAERPRTDLRSHVLF